MSGQAMDEIELTDPPLDGISRLRFNAQDNLLVSSWDSFLRLYDTHSNALRGKIDGLNPLLDCAFENHRGSKGFSAGLDHTIRQYDFETGSSAVVGQHEAPVRCIETSAEHLLISGGWDHQLQLWDLRGSSRVAQVPVPGKVFSLDVVNHLCLVATSERKIQLYDVRQLQKQALSSVEDDNAEFKPMLEKESALKYQLRAARLFPSARGYVMASTEGRVAVEYLTDDIGSRSTDDDIDSSSSEKKKKKKKNRKGYAFKCHRQKMQDQTFVFPVNTIAFHPTYGTFCTGGCDGTIHVWDGDRKKRISHFRTYPTSISSLEFNPTGTKLAIASSYTFEEGQKDHPPDAIFIRNVQDVEVKPKEYPA